MNKTIFAYMTPFLKQVTDHYYKKGNIEDRCFIFPNRRSMVFFRKYLGEAVRGAQCPVLSPKMFTMNDFFSQASGLKTSDRIPLLLELYKCYAALNPKAETLDEFVFWGDVILGDFNDTDKYLVDPKQLFTNVSDFKQLQDAYSYLTDNQRRAVENFVSHFNDRSGKLTVDLGSDHPDIKDRFLQIWNILYQLYVDFNAVLEGKGMAYEGMVYKRLAKRLNSKAVADVIGEMFPDRTSFVFVGLNALNECEKSLLGKLRDASLAEFCWDWTGDMIQDERNRSSVFMKDNVRNFPQAAVWDAGGLEAPCVNVISVASSTGQAKRLPDILKKDDDFAVVLPDESLLVPVLNSIPEDISDINVTMGLPMNGSRIYTFMSDLSAVQLHTVCRKDKWYFYHKQVWDLFSSELFRKALDEVSLEKVLQVKESAKYYIPIEDLSGTSLLETIFRPIVTDLKSASREQINAFAEYQKDVIRAVASGIKDDPHLALELEYAKEYYKCVNILQDISLEVLPVTYVRLLAQLLGGVSVPFRGEPLKGLQIMGPLETRALDFRNLVILSANEGVFPRRNVSSSFIPPELRKGFGLPTYEYQDAIWAYYFYRMISRAENVWMMVDSRTEGLKSGEESRYIKQLEYHFGLPLKRYVVQSEGMKTAELPPVMKTLQDVEKIRNTVLSATVLQNYLACPAKFYYGTVKELQAEEEVSESLDYGMFGTVYHDTIRAVYSVDDGESISREYIKYWLGRGNEIREIVKSVIIREMNAVEVSGRNLVVADVITRYVLKTLECDLQQLEEAGIGAFTILGRELKVSGELHGQKFKGFIDRLDSFAPDQARVVDYKTGRVLDEDENIDDDNAEAVAEKIFAPDVKDRPKIALQFYIYDMLVESLPQIKGRRIYNCVYSTSRLFSSLPSVVPANSRFCSEMTARLKNLLDEMYDVSVPFRRTEDQDICKYCDFKSICGR